MPAREFKEYEGTVSCDALEVVIVQVERKLLNTEKYVSPNFLITLVIAF